MSARDNVLERIRGALHRRSGDGALELVRVHLAARALSPRPAVAGDLVSLFRARALALSSSVAEVDDLRGVPAAVADYLLSHALPMTAVCWPALAALDWAACGVTVQARAACESDKVGITSAFCAIAETGTLMTLSGSDTPPSVSLLPETHIAVVRVSQIVPAMEEAWQRLRATPDYPPRAVNFISGPSRTADIEQTLTFGAHGPYRVHVVVIQE
jgi:L-lactate dehydrogenase complex protein LldG